MNATRNKSPADQEIIDVLFAISTVMSCLIACHGNKNKRSDKGAIRAMHCPSYQSGRDAGEQR